MSSWCGQTRARRSEKNTMKIVQARAPLMGAHMKARCADALFGQPVAAGFSTSSHVPLWRIVKACARNDWSTAVMLEEDDDMEGYNNYYYCES